MRFIVAGNIRQRIITIQANLRRLPEQIHAITQAVIDRSEDEVLDMLGFEPPAASFAYGKFPWTSENQRKYVLGFVLKGKKYKRRGKKPRGWRLFGIKAPNGAIIIVRNENPIAVYLHGKFDSVKPQQKFHHIIGWTTASAARVPVLVILIRNTKQVVSEQAAQLIFG